MLWWGVTSRQFALLCGVPAMAMSTTATATAALVARYEALCEVPRADPAIDAVAPSDDGAAFARLLDVGTLRWSSDAAWWLGAWGAVRCMAEAAARGLALGERAYVGAVRSGELDALRWLRERGYTPLGPSACYAAARHGRIDALLWLRDEAGCAWDAAASAGSARGGHLDALRRMRARQTPCPWDAETCAQAAEHGHVHVLCWAVGAGCPVDGAACDRAAAAGQLEALGWAIGAGLPLGASACVAAARAGRLDVLALLHRSGAPWTEEAVAAAAAHGHDRVLRWAKRRRPADKETTADEALDECARRTAHRDTAPHREGAA